MEVTPARPISPAVGVIQTGDGRGPYSPMERRAMSVEPRGALSSVATGKTGGLYVEPWEAERLQPRTSLEKKPKETSPKRNFSSFSAATGDRGAYALRPLQSRYRRGATRRARLDAFHGGILSSVILLIYAAAIIHKISSTVFFLILWMRWFRWDEFVVVY